MKVCLSCLLVVADACKSLLREAIKAEEEEEEAVRRDLCVRALVDVLDATVQYSTSNTK